MAITIYDIAREANMSHTTVSMALRDMPQVKMATRRKIRELADRLGYQPNQVAVSLKAGCSRRIALIMPEGTLQLNHPLIEQFGALCHQNSYEMVLLQLAPEPERIRDLFEGLLQGGYDAAVTYLYDFTSVRDLLERFLAQKKPLALVGPPLDFEPRPGLFALNIDNSAAVRGAVRMLMALGHRHIAHTIPPEFKVCNSASNRAIRSTLLENGVNDWEPEFFYSSTWSSNWIRCGYQSAQLLLKNKPETTAIQCANDLFACGMIRGLQDLGIRVPEDISVIGSDNTEYGEFFSVSLSSFDLRLADTARALWQWLSRQLLWPDWDTIPEVVTLQGNLVVRESTGKVRDYARLTDKKG